MNTNALRQKILDLAIHGKLVKQDPSDEPASVMLEKLRAEKEAKIAAGEVKRNKNDSYIFKYTGTSGESKTDDNPERLEHNRHYEKFADGMVKDIEDEIPFAVPEGWAWCRLGEISSELGDGIHGTPEYTQNGSCYFINGTNLSNGKIIIKQETKTVDEEQYEKYKKDLSSNTMFISINGTLGNIAFYNNEHIILGKSVCYFNLVNEKFKYFFYFLFNGHYFQKYVEVSATGSTIKNVSLKAMNRFLIPLPPLSEQHRIVTAIEAIFTRIDLLEQNKVDLQTAVKQAKSKILDLAIHGKLVKQDPADEPASVMLEKLRAEKETKIAAGEIKRGKHDSYIYRNPTDNCYYEKFGGESDVCIDNELPFELPANWQWCRLGEIGDTNIGLTYHPEDLIDTGIPVLRSHNIQDEKLCLSDLARVQTKIFENQYVSNGSILICTRNGSKNLVGKCTIIENLPEKMVFGAFMAVFRSKFNPYILRYLQSFYFKDYLRESNSTQIYQLTQNMLRNALIPIPPISEQKRIVARIEEIFNILDTIQTHLI